MFYCAIDELYQEVAPPSAKRRRGHERQKMSDSEIICLSVMQEGRSNDSELSFHRRVKQDYQHLFPDLVSRSRYHRRRKDLMGVQREMLRALMKRMRMLAAWLMVDSAPITTAFSPRWKSARMSVWAAEAGYAEGILCFASKRQFFLGFRLHLLVSEQGLICDFVLSPANVGERRVAEHLLAAEAARAASHEAPLPVLADNGYCGDWLAGLFGRQGGALWYALRRSREPATSQEAAARRWHRAKRARARGSVFASLEDQFEAETTRARSVWGVMARVVAKLLAYALGCVINRALGRPMTALKSLYR